ncbi:hypothetical protein BC940DRAFT_99569 [Gongronella butleri]|nr:hypothetical protein BC940DRAFT_99569 [Gongronella butleri]
MTVRTAWICCIVWSALSTALAQYSAPTFLWQSIVYPQQYGYSYLQNATFKYYSQDFQSVYLNRDEFGHNERVLINLGDACSTPSYDDVQALNNNSIISSFVKAQPLMGLVARGGRCDSWLTKVNNVQALGHYYQISGILLYDNATYGNNAGSFTLQHLPSDASPPQWVNKTLDPPARNISNMPDNDLHGFSSYLAVYFAPHDFGMAMLDKVASYSFGVQVPSNQQKYVQVAAYFQEQTMADNPSPSASNNANSQSNNDDFFNNSIDNRGYIAYLVAAGAAIILGFVAIVLFRWCRHPRWLLRRRGGMADDEENLERFGLRSLGSEHGGMPHVPIEKLNELAPIQRADQVILYMKNSTCSICLDDFSATSDVRVLPCHHGFCVDCIDVWLTKKSSWCPICKYDILDPDKNSAEGDKVAAAEDDGIDLGTATMDMASSLPSSSTSSPSSPPLVPMRHDTWPHWRAGQPLLVPDSTLTHVHVNAPSSSLTGPASSAASSAVNVEMASNTVPAATCSSSTTSPLPTAVPQEPDVPSESATSTTMASEAHEDLTRPASPSTPTPVASKQLP